jgi:hypothetical protein
MAAVIHRTKNVRHHRKSKITRTKEDRQKQNGVPGHIVDNVKGEERNNSEIAAARKIRKRDGEWIYISDPNGSHGRLR